MMGGLDRNQQIAQATVFCRGYGREGHRRAALPDWIRTGCDLAVESWIAEPRFSHLFRPEVVMKADQALREAQLLINARRSSS